MSEADVTLEITAQLELDAAWEAHRVAAQDLVAYKSKYEELARNRQRDYPMLQAFEEIASMAANGPHLTDKLAAAKLLQIRDVITRARERSQDIAQRQVERQKQR